MNLNQGNTNRNKYRWIWISLVVIVLILIAGYPIYKALHAIADPLRDRESPLRKEQVHLTEKEPFSLLLLGIESNGRTDTTMVITVNPKQRTIKMLGIPEDTRVQIARSGNWEKISHAYQKGGVELSMETVERFLDIPIDYHVTINTEGVKELIDAIGGITIENPQDFTYDGQHFAAGRIQLNGSGALAYMRMRELEPDGEEGRQKRRHEVIEEVIRSGANIHTLTNYDKIATTLMNNVKTNITLKEMLKIKNHYQEAVQHINYVDMEGSVEKIDGIYYEVISQKEVERIRGIFQKHMEYFRDKR